MSTITMTRKPSTSKKTSSGNIIGTSSILLIFVLLCLVSFAALSIVSANADNKLSLKVEERVTAYYEACNKGEDSLASLDQTLQSIYSNVSDEETYFSTAGHASSYLIPISDIQSLEITLTILYPETSDGPYYHIESWNVIQTAELDYNESLNVPK